MKNSILISIIIFLTNFYTYSQIPDFKNDSALKQKINMGTVDLGFGIVQNKMRSTASTATISSEVLEQRAAISLQDAFYGCLLGLTTIKDGSGWVGNSDFGANYNVRGIQSLTGDNDILVVIDGFPGSIDRLSVDEIESVTVLKDAAAIALYGYIGVNGVLSVKTKRGPKSGEIISTKYHHKFTFTPEFPEFLDAYTYANAANEGRSNDGLSPTYNHWELDAFKTGSYSYLYPNVNWREEIMRNMGSEDVLSLSYANGDEKMRVFSMLNYTNSQGLLKGTEENKDIGGYSTQLKLSKANVRTNIDVDLTSTTKLEANVLGILYETNRPSGITADGVFSILSYLPSGTFPIKTHDNIWGGNNIFTFSNPVAQIQESGYYREIGRVLNANFKLTQSLDDFINGLSLSGRFGYRSEDISYEIRNRQFAWASDRYIFDTSGTPIGTEINADNTVRQAGGATANILSFSRGNVGYLQDINFVLSADYQKQYEEQNFAASLIYYSNKSLRKAQYNTFYRKNFMGYAHYDLSNRYMADIVLTYSGSSRSYPKSWVFSPTVSLAWILSEENFLKSSDVIDFLKIRASYGRLHTDYVPLNGSIWMSIYNSAGGYNFNTQLAPGFVSSGGIAQNYLPTTDFRLETANKYNVGLDALLFNSVGINFEAFYQRRNNILVSEYGLYSATAGIFSGFVNKGVVDSKGIELGVDYNYKFRDLSVNVGGIYTFATNRVIDTVEEPKAYPWLEIKGQRVGQYRGLEAIGFFEDNDDIIDSPTQEFSVVKPGDVKYKEQKNEGTVNENDNIPIGYSSIVPEINYAFNLGLEYKGIGFNIVFQGVSRFSKNYIPGTVIPLVENQNISTEYYENRWIPGQDNSNAKYPALSTLNNENNYRNSTIWYRDASFLKLRNCEIYYKTPLKVSANRSIEEIKFSVRGENLYTWSKFEDIDPEVPYSLYPMMKGVSVGLSISF